VNKNILSSFFFEKGSKWRNQVEKSATFGSQQNRDEKNLDSFVYCFLFQLAEVYIQRSATITKGEKGSEMWQKFLGF